MKTLQVTPIFDSSIYDPEKQLDIPQYLYKVVKVTNSLVPPVTENISPDDLSVYCDSEDWHVTIK